MPHVVHINGCCRHINLQDEPAGGMSGTLLRRILRSTSISAPTGTVPGVCP
jgi:hypothetical protein